MGAIQSMKGDKRAAARLIGRAATLLPERADIAYNHGVALREIGDIAAAAAEWRRTLTIEPGHRDALGNLALALDQLGDMVGAVDVYGQLLERRPDDREALYQLRQSLPTRRRNRRRRSRSTSAFSSSFPASPPAGSTTACSLKGIRDWGGAEKCYRRAIAADAGSAVAHFNLSNLLLTAARWQRRLRRV